MHKSLFIGLLGTMLVACGGGNGDESSSSDSSTSTSSSSSTSSVSTSSSSSSSSSTSSSPNFNGNAAVGAQTFKTKCEGCHKDSDGDGYFDEKNTTIDVDDLGTTVQFGNWDASSVENVSAFINDYMDSFSGGCDQTCSDDTAAFLWSLKDGTAGPSTVAASCANPNDIHYGKRVISVLTSYEYHNSLQKLFGAPLPADYSSPAKVGLDFQVARLPNQSTQAINETRLNAYYDNAVEIADWAMSTPGALPFACDDAISCSNDFIRDFAYVAYRRALNDEEQAEIAEIFEKAPSVDDGLKWALRTVLMSPNFLYRREIGTQVADLLANPVVAPGTDYDFDGMPTVYSDITITPYNRLNLGNNDYNYNWTGNDLVALTIKGGQNNIGSWPVLRVGVGYSNEDTIETLTINHSGSRTYYFLIDFIPNAPLYFHHDANQVQEGYTLPNLEVSELAVGPLGTSEPVQDDVAKLMAADQNAYALDPYEYASALSFALTGSGPSKALLDAAVAGELVDVASREMIVNELIDSDLGRAHVRRLAGKWFRTDGLASKARNDVEFTQAVRSSMMEEIRQIYQHVFYNGDFPSMYEGDYTFLNSTLSDFYGIGGGGSSQNDYRMVSTAGTDRGGIIASGAYMAYNAHMDYTSPIQRSAHFRMDVLCQAIPLPVNLEDSDEREAAAEAVEAQLQAGNITTASYYDQQTRIPNSSCLSCHNAIINPLFALDDFDNVGRLRPRQNGEVVQNSLTYVNGVAVPQGANVLGIDHVNEGGYLYAYDVVGTLSSAKADAAKISGDGLMFTGAKDLGKVIVENDLPGIPACLIEKTSRFALGYTLDKAFLNDSETGYYGISDNQEAEFACVQDQLESAYASQKSPRDVLKALVMSDSFRFRK